MKRKEQRKKLRQTVRIVLLSVLILCAAVTVFCMIPCRTETAAVSAMQTGENVTVRVLEEGKTAFIPDEPAKAGLIFYPGARIRSEAYAPLMRALAEQGILAVTVEVPFCLAFLDVDAADGVAEQLPEIRSWYVGGHSLGAAIAGQYLGRHTDSLDGLVMFAGFTVRDLSDADVRVISVYGDRDGILTEGLYRKYRCNLPDSLKELVIEGGNHAGFGCYGDQLGDCAATIPKEQQISAAARYCAEQIDQFQTEKETKK